MLAVKKTQEVNYTKSLPLRGQYPVGDTDTGGKKVGGRERNNSKAG